MKQAEQFLRFKKLIEEVEKEQLNSAERKPPERVNTSVTAEEPRKDKTK